MKLASAMFLTPALLLVVGLAATAAAADEGSRDEKIFSFLELVKIPNDICKGASKNGTCYTADECKSKGGSASGSCGKGYGVCCIFELSCGGKSSDNNTYVVQASKSTFTAAERGCSYKICPISSDVTRMRFDFQTFVIANPVLATAEKLTGTPAITDDNIVGRCLTDSFAITGSPSICGTNSGQHMILDSDGMNCLSLMFAIGSKTGTSRSWTILATQYRAGEEEASMAGPSGCLQYFTAKSGYFSSFNFPALTLLGASTTHLADQNYNVCFRRESGNCQICYWPKSHTTADTVTDPGSFGISLTLTANKAKVTAEVDAGCTSDYLVIPNAQVSTLSGGAAGKTSIQKFCGRFLGSKSAAIAHVTICTQSLPFMVNVVFDGGDRIIIAAASMTDKNENQGPPQGTLGFGLWYTQKKSCT